MKASEVRDACAIRRSELKRPGGDNEEEEKPRGIGGGGKSMAWRPGTKEKWDATPEGRRAFFQAAELTGIGCKKKKRGVLARKKEWVLGCS